jgi:hypothetical protein
MSDLTGRPPMTPVGTVEFVRGRVGQAFFLSKGSSYLLGPATVEPRNQRIGGSDRDSTSPKLLPVWAFIT